MILLTTPSARVAECAAAIHGGTSHKVQTAATLQEAIGLLREAEYPVVVLDQCMLDADPDQAEVALQHTGTALVVNVNCAIAGTERIVREVRTALRRRQREVQTARVAAEQELRNDLREPLTALLLDCELALSLPNVAAPTKEKLRSIHELARTLRNRIGAEEPILA